jgi:AcrR family transcriptional regulator
MAIRKGADARQRRPLSKERVLRTAMTLADDGGIDSLSMRKLAQKLAVEPMSLYFYVANKAQLLSGMADIVISEFELPESRGDWRAEVRRSAVSAHDVLMRHPWACTLVMSTKTNAPARLRQMEWLLGHLRDAGFSAEMTHYAYHALDSHIIGSTLWESGFSANPDLLNVAKSFVQRAHDAFPRVAEHAEQHFAPRRNAVRAFEFGLDLILDGLEKVRDTSSVRSASAQGGTDRSTRTAPVRRRRAH